MEILKSSKVYLQYLNIYHLQNWLFVVSLFICFFFHSSVYSQNITLSAVQYLQPDTDTFSSFVDIQIQSGKYLSIKPSKTVPKKIQYIIPSFCDAFTTLGTNSLNGQNTYSDIKLALRSYTNHGFTHIVSVADGPWIKQVQSEIAKNKLVGPDIIISPKPLLNLDKENKDISDLLYFKGKSNTDFLDEATYQLKSHSHIFMFYRYNEGSNFKITPSLIHSLNLKANENSSKLYVATFADSTSILESLVSGVNILYHPIPYKISKSIKQAHLNSLVWSPMFINYFFLRADERNLTEVFEYTAKQSTFFKKYYSPSSSAISPLLSDEATRKKAQTEYIGYLTFLEKNRVLKKQMFLSSGSGNLFAFHGLAGLWELKILETMIDSKKDVLRIPTKNTCGHLGIEYQGIIKEGQEANLLVLDENPLKTFDTLFSPAQVIKKGKRVPKL